MPNEYDWVERSGWPSLKDGRMPMQPAGSWHPTTETIVRQLLASAEPVAVALRPGHDAVYNAAFTAIIGAEVPQNTSQSLANLCGAIWPRLAPLVERAGAGQSVQLDDQLLCRYRNGSAEEAYLRFACRPFLDETGVVIGVILTITDQTEHVISFRRTAALREIAAAAAPRSSVQQACARALAAVARHGSDVPFALLYLRVEETQRLRLAATAGIAPGTAASQEMIDSQSEVATTWPAHRALRLNETLVVDDLLNRFGTLPAGDWPFAPRRAIVAPVTPPGRTVPEGVLICGVSARQPLDAAYRAFIDLVVNQIAAAIAGGRIHEDEERAAQARASARVARAKRQARLRALKAKFAGALEERTRLAREIHDTLLQGVTGVALQLRAVLPDVRTESGVTVQVLESIVELAERTSREARLAVWDMRPTKRVKRDLARTLEITAQRLIAAAPIQVRLSTHGKARMLDARREDAVIRVAQEAIANVIRHAEARTIRLHIVFEGRRFCLTISDDGVGFDVANDFHSYDGHWGLLGMQERVNHLGGDLDVRSTPGSGTSVTLRLPYGGTARPKARGIGVTVIGGRE